MNINTNSYYTQEIQSKINEMTDSEMKSIFVELEKTRFWIAILKYNQKRMLYAQSTLMSTDPVEEAGKIARAQGIMLGISDLPDAIITVKKEFEDKDKQSEEEKSQ